MSRPAMFGENIRPNDGIGISGEGFDDQIQLDPDFQLWDSYLESLTPSSTMFNGSTFEAKPQNSSNVPQDDPAFQISGATSSNETESTANMSTSLGSGSSEEPTFDSKLLDLSDRLVSHVNTIPPVSIHTHLHPNDVGAFRKAKEDYNFSIEETFQLTQTMIDLYAGLTNIMKPTSNERQPQHEDDLEGPESTAEQPSEQGHKVLGRCANMPSRVDSATILLALSCHHRLIYIWDNVFIHFNEMLKNNVFQHPNYLQKYSCSQLKIGSFVPVSPAGSASTLMMLIWDSLRTLHQSLETFSESIRFYSTARKTSGRSSSDIGDTSEPLSEDIGIEILALHSTVGACGAAITLSTKLQRNQTFSERRWSTSAP